MPDLDRLADRKLASHVVDGGRLRALVLELWQRTRMDWGFVTDRLSTTFRKETWVGSFKRTIDLPEQIDSSKISAELNDGVLAIRIGKREEAKTKLINVQAN